ncbi:MAG: carbohydrate kinase family protein [Gammaproteobacteria bacterium]|nr:carbohydrate kinase family protein [Gammaproteobacteria bacterium]
MAGIACAGNWVLDRSKFINYYPEISGHTTVYNSIPSTGGGALNVLVSLARLQPAFPTYGVGIVGEGSRARELMQLCEQSEVNCDYVKRVAGQSSFTDAYILPDGSRTIFHCPGVNNLLSLEDIPVEMLKQQGVKLFYLGHLMILDALDAPDSDYGTKSARLLSLLQAAGMETAIDMVSNPSLSYDKLVIPALRYTDHLICNEFEAEQLTGIKVRQMNGQLSADGMKRSARRAFELGVEQSVTFHSPQEAYCLLIDGSEYYQPALTVPSDKIIASCGAGDAFCAGMLYGIHEGWDRQKALLLGVCTAAASLTAATNSEGIDDAEKMLMMAQE